MPYTIDYKLDRINESLQIGDTVYHTSSNTIGLEGSYQFDVNDNIFSDIVKIGTVTLIDRVNNKIRITGDLNLTLPENIGFLFFSKDNAHDLSSIKGYYAELKMTNNNSETKSELFQISLAADVSSK
jgi:hypothetical protein